MKVCWQVSTCYKVLTFVRNTPGNSCRGLKKNEQYSYRQAASGLCVQPGTQNCLRLLKVMQSSHRHPHYNAWKFRAILSCNCKDMMQNNYGYLVELWPSAHIKITKSDTWQSHTSKCIMSENFLQFCQVISQVWPKIYWVPGGTDDLLRYILLKTVWTNIVEKWMSYDILKFGDILHSHYGDMTLWNFKI